MREGKKKNITEKNTRLCRDGYLLNRIPYMMIVDVKIL